MRVVMIDPPAHFLEERRRLGHDHQDEMWEGVLHVAPQPTSRHQRLAMKLAAVVLPVAEARGLVGLTEPAVYNPERDDDYRVPQFAFARRQHISERGIEGQAELVVEIRSPGDETYDKLGFYARVGCREVLVVDRDTLAVELFEGGERRGGERRGDGPVELASVGVRLVRVGPDALRVEWEGGAVEIALA